MINEKRIVTLDLLVLKPQDKPVYFIVEGARDESETDPDVTVDYLKQFTYDEHSCPVNWLKPVMVYYDGDSDPHGLIEYVATRDDSTFPKDESNGPNDRDSAMIAFVEQHAKVTK